MFQGTYLTSLQQHLLIHIKIKKITVKQYTMAKKIIKSQISFLYFSRNETNFSNVPLGGL